MPSILYVATGNAGKLLDFSTIGMEFGEAARFEPLPGLDAIPAPAEDGATFQENATKKAEEYSRYAPGEIVLADDSGLEVDALNGSPGVRSARYATDAGLTDVSARLTDERNNLLLLKNLTGVPAQERAARYRCVLAAARDGSCIAFGRGSVEGAILDSARGTGGFGYDPLFFLPEMGKSMAEIDLKTKLQISHRGNALRDLLRALRQLGLIG